MKAKIEYFKPIPYTGTQFIRDMAIVGCIVLLLEIIIIYHIMH